MTIDCLPPCRYFKSSENLLKLRNIVCTYVWEHLSDGYSQGMCDLLAPLLIILDDEALTFACYLRWMEQMETFDIRLANVQELLQVHTDALIRTCLILANFMVVFVMYMYTNKIKYFSA